MKRNSLILGMSALLAVLCFGCGDSLKARLTRRLNNFRNALPEAIREKFDKGEYQEAGRMLDERILQVRSFTEKMPDENRKRQFIRGEYEGLEAEIKKLAVPAALLEFNREFWKIQDYECIPTFTGPQVVDYFKVYFKEKLDSLK